VGFCRNAPALDYGVQIVILVTCPPENRFRGRVRMGLGITIGVRMKKKGFSAEQIVGKLREAEVSLSQGSTVGEVSRKLEATEQTYNRSLTSQLSSSYMKNY